MGGTPWPTDGPPESDGQAPDTPAILILGDSSQPDCPARMLKSCLDGYRIDSSDGVAQCLSMLSARPYAVVAIDLCPPWDTALASVRLLTRLPLRVPILGISAQPDPVHLGVALATGIAGCVSAHEAPNDIRSAVMIASAGGIALGPRIVAALENCQRKRERLIDASNFGLTAREAEILCLANQGYRYRQIADILGSRPSTIYTHVRHIYQKLDVRTMQHAIFKARNRIGEQPRAAASPRAAPPRAATSTAVNALAWVAQRSFESAVAAHESGSHAWMASTTSADREPSANARSRTEKMRSRC